MLNASLLLVKGLNECNKTMLVTVGLDIFYGHYEFLSFAMHLNLLHILKN